jgi:hypothetical protein
VILLAGITPNLEIDFLFLHDNVCGVVVERSWNIFARRSIGRIAEKKARPIATLITDNEALDTRHPDNILEIRFLSRIAIGQSVCQHG